MRCLFDAATHPIDAVQRAAYRFSDRISIEIRREKNDLHCELYPRPGVVLDDELLHDFRTEVLDQVLRGRIRTETAPVRNLILAAAFEPADLSDEPLE